MKKFILLASVAILALGNTSEARAKISCVFSNNNEKVTISGEGSDVASASACNAANSSSTDDNWEYNSDWKNRVKAINIGKGVTTIGGNAFNWMIGVTSLTISDSVTSIGGGAFAGMSGVTGELKIPEGVTSIGGYAFAGMSGVTGELNIPKGVTSIGGHAFEGMSGITGELKIPEGVTTIGNHAFSGMRGVTSLKIPEGVTSIGGSAFWRMSGVTGELVIPDSVTFIGNSAFDWMSGLTSLTIPDSVTSVGDAFKGVKEVLIPDTLVVTDDWNDSAFNNNSVNIRCLGDLDKCIKALKKYLPESQGGSCTNPNYCLNINKIVPATKEQCGVGMYTWNETTEKCKRMTEWQCNDYRDENNKRKYYYNGNTCTKLPKNGKISCVNACYKINDGYCDRVCYTPAEAAEIAKDSGNVVTLTFKKQ